jgi:hypothetical protein
MPDEPVVPVEEPTTADTTDYAKRYNDLRPQYDRTYAENQQLQDRLRELEQYENDRDAYFKLGEKHGVQFEIEEEQQAAPTGDPQTAAELAELRAWKEEVQQERQERAYAEGEKAVRGQHNEWAKEAGLTLSDFDHDAIIKRALDSGANDIDDVKRVFDAYVAHKTAEREAILAEAAEARRRPRAPHVPGGGGADTGTPDFSQMTEAQALAWQVERARGLTQ